MSTWQKGSFVQNLVDLRDPRVDFHETQDSGKTISICAVDDCSFIWTKLVNGSWFSSRSLFNDGAPRWC
jgi:hypothetical protein